jgi:hypothetical protein
MLRGRLLKNFKAAKQDYISYFLLDLNIYLNQ